MAGIQKEVNTYRISDLTIGQSESFSVTVTEQMQDRFREITGDINPMHVDADFAKAGGFSDKLVYGMLTASFFSTLVGVYLPGKNCLFRECDVQWPGPVYVGDTLAISGRITDINTQFNVVEIKAEVRNQEQKKVARAKLQVEVRPDE